MRSVVPGLLALILLLSCGPSFNRKEPIFTGDQEAFFRLDSDDFPAQAIRDQMPKQIPYIDLTEDQLSRVFATLSYERASTWGGVTRRVFYNEQLRDLAHRMREVSARLDNTKRLVTVIRHDPNKSVLSQMERTTMVSWFDEAGLNVVLGEIRQEIPHNDMLERQEWLSILPVSLKRSYNDLMIKPSPFYQHKKINGMTHNTWVVFSLDKIESLPSVPPDVDTHITEEPRKNRRQDRPGDKSDQGEERDPANRESDMKRDEGRPDRKPEPAKTETKTEIKPQTDSRMQKVEAKETKPAATEMQPKADTPKDKATKPESKPEIRETSSEARPATDATKNEVKPANDDATKKLADLKQALEQGLITQEEYEARRKAILDRIN
ncbi:MAG: SHOCT domain-containing protein [Leptospirales bacterium]|nr:SHOCT domain-containing protein [Leptospirales bacterium]